MGLGLSVCLCEGLKGRVNGHWLVNMCLIHDVLKVQ